VFGAVPQQSAFAGVKSRDEVEEQRDKSNTKQKSGM